MYRTTYMLKLIHLCSCAWHATSGAIFHFYPPTDKVVVFTPTLCKLISLCPWVSLKWVVARRIVVQIAALRQEETIGDKTKTWSKVGDTVFVLLWGAALMKWWRNGGEMVFSVFLSVSMRYSNVTAAGNAGRNKTTWEDTCGHAGRLKPLINLKCAAYMR